MAETPLTEAELVERLELARTVPGVAHLILAGPSPTCELCGGRSAPIIGGKHLSPERFCEQPNPDALGGHHDG